MLPLGTLAPDFALKDARTGATTRLVDLADKPGLLVMFICNHCPFVKHIAGELAALGRDLANSGIAIVAINSNDFTKYPDDSPEQMKVEAEVRGYEFPYLIDETQEVAKAYRAACTPDFYLFDEARELVYRGQLDDSRPGNGAAIDGADLRAACAALPA